MSVYIEIASTLMDLEAELRRIGQWDAEPPSPTALASVEPFCVDTMTLAQWLQFIFIPRMYALAEAQQLPPGRCEIQPMAEEYFNGSKLDGLPLLRHIARLDALINSEK
ncbi:MAG: YqcC family protein [Spongiibacteraceae bacterium]